MCERERGGGEESLVVCVRHTEREGERESLVCV